jgi:hypothetical protein
MDYKYLEKIALTGNLIFHFIALLIDNYKYYEKEKRRKTFI